MPNNIQAIRGMNDILPSEVGTWQFLEDAFRRVVASYGYQEIRFPIVEKTELFKRSIGEVTDIVEKEMYTFEDRNGDSLSLRPEGTAVCVRAGIEHGLIYNNIQRLWYMGPMFRHERPQKGRYRQFYQLGVEVFGIPGADIDAEIIILAARLWQELGLSEKVKLQINTLGTPESREKYRKDLVKFFSQHMASLDEDSLRRLDKNPLRILDSKNPEMREIISEAPSLLNYLDEKAQGHFDTLKRLLDAVGLEYEVNPRLVRGLDYYMHTVFEWVTDELGSQGTVCAGGRYDGLVEMLGGHASTAVGFAMGVERLVALLDSIYSAEQLQQPLDAYLIVAGENAQAYAFQLAEKLRAAVPNFRLVTNCGEGSFKSQFKRADKSGATMALILGEDEITQNRVTIKFLREDRPQQSMSYEELIRFLQQR